MNSYIVQIVVEGAKSPIFNYRGAEGEFYLSVTPVTIMEKGAPRRKIIFISALGWAAGFSGCFSPTIGSDDTETLTVSSTDDNDDSQTLEFESKILTQQSGNDPIMIRTEIRNMSENKITLLTGPTLVFFPRSGIGEGILLYPDQYIGPNETPENRKKNCWRYTDNDFLVQDIEKQHSLSPGEEITEDHAVYTIGKEGCLPEGEYIFEDKVTLSKIDQEITLILHVTVSNGKVASVSPQISDA